MYSLKLWDNEKLWFCWPVNYHCILGNIMSDVLTLEICALKLQCFCHGSDATGHSIIASVVFIDSWLNQQNRFFAISNFFSSWTYNIFVLLVSIVMIKELACPPHFLATYFIDISICNNNYPELFTISSQKIQKMRK